VPSIFTTFEVFGSGVQYGLCLLCPLADDVRYSVFGAFVYNPNATSPMVPSHVNAVAKLVYRHYGTAVHQALYQPEGSDPGAPTYTPILYGCSSKPGINAYVYIMEYLGPPSFSVPGWLTLAEANQDMVAGELESIYPVLEKIVNHLSRLNFVHGDLRPNNIMIKMRNRSHLAVPVEIKVVDFEWADKVGIARYPHNRNEEIGYPGKAGDVIGKNDDRDMINKWRKGIQDYIVRDLARATAAMAIGPR
jgi:serine/threonine protein kinase